MGPVTEETWLGPWCMGVGQLSAGWGQRSIFSAEIPELSITVGVTQTHE